MVDAKSDSPNGSIKLEDIRKLDSYQSVRRWFKEKEAKTRDSYGRCMVMFTRSSGMDPDQFLEWAKNQKDSLDVQDMIDRMTETIRSESIKFTFKVGLRSFLRTNGYGRLPRSNLTYTLLTWHRGYRKEEIRKLLSFLDNKMHKLLVYIAAESGLRADTVLKIKYKHIKEDLEAGVVPVAIRLGPEFYNKPKSSGFTFLGPRSLALLRDCIKNGLIQTKDESLLFQFKYTNAWKFLNAAKKQAGLDPKISPHHGLRKYFEHALDEAHLDDNVKAVLEGHFSGVRAKHYSEREWESLRPEYQKAYPFIDIDTGDPELVKKLEGWQADKAQLLEKFQNEKREWRTEMDEIQNQLKQLKELLLREKEKERGPSDIDSQIRQLEETSPKKQKKKS